MSEVNESKEKSIMNENANENKGKRRSKKGKPSKFTLKDIISSRVARRTTSLMWEAENDPFQVFEVEHESCLDLEIVVKNGEQITKGFYKDLIDVPDPYVVLKIPGSSNSSKRTSHVDNNVNPIWDETFHFFLDPKREHTLHITLMDANHFQDDDLGTESLDVNMLVQNVPTEFTFEFPGGSRVNTVLTLQKNKHPDLRFSLSLCEEEKQFLRQRRLKVMQQMQKLLGDKAPQNKHEVPIIAVLGSGGGFRAMSCFSAAVKALHESGILGCCTYMSGLSGSSWFISTLYAHDKFPDVTYSEIYNEIKESVTHNWKWQLMHCHRYFLDMMHKSRCGQPVSFTDIFGHLLGDVLLKGKKHKTLSDQKKIVAEGRVPLPLYTCLHAKASVSCRAFSEWIEFSPFEIGIAKYGTFMKTEYFGSKFLVGKLIKQFPELPLHYLQGVWGSAFTILMKRLAFDGGSKQDIVQMMRDVTEERAMHEKLESQYLGGDDETQTMVEKDSSTDDEVDVEGADDKNSEEENDDQNNSRRGSQNTLEVPLEANKRTLDIPTDNQINKTLEDDIAAVKNLLEQDDLQNLKSGPSNDEKENETENGNMANPSIIVNSPNEAHKLPKTPKKGSGKERTMRKGFSFDFVKPNLSFQRNYSQDETNQRKISSQSDPGSDYQQKTNMSVRNERLQRKGAIKESKKESVKESNYWKDKRLKRKTQKEKKSTIIQNWMKTSNVLNSRAGRAGEILNPFRGLSLRNSFPISPFSSAIEGDDEDVSDTDGIGLRCRYQALDNTAKKLFIVDSGLAFNSPYPLLLRPQRAVDMYLSFDFSQRPSDRHMPFKELLLAEKWAQQNEVSFPPIEKLAREFSKDPEVKELYVFKDPDDPFCPVILHFTLVNNKFKWFSAPGVQRETTEEIDFANFSVFDDPSQPYASTNFVYEPLQYERLFKLVEFNTLISIDKIKEEIAEIVEKKSKLFLKSVENNFDKMWKVLSACKRFQGQGNMSLRINEDQRRKFMSVRKTVGVSGRQHSVETSSSYEGSPPMFYDAKDSFELSEENDSDIEEDEESEQFEEVHEIDREIERENAREMCKDSEENAPKMTQETQESVAKMSQENQERVAKMTQETRENAPKMTQEIQENARKMTQETQENAKITKENDLEMTQDDALEISQENVGEIKNENIISAHEIEHLEIKENLFDSYENNRQILRKVIRQTEIQIDREIEHKNVRHEQEYDRHEQENVRQKQENVRQKQENIRQEQENVQHEQENYRQEQETDVVILRKKCTINSRESETVENYPNTVGSSVEINNLDGNKLSAEEISQKTLKIDKQFSSNLERKEDEGTPLHMVQNLTAVI